jgi:hypothetical protein
MVGCVRRRWDGCENCFHGVKYIRVPKVFPLLIRALIAENDGSCIVMFRVYSWSQSNEPRCPRPCRGGLACVFR